MTRQETRQVFGRRDMECAVVKRGSGGRITVAEHGWSEFVIVRPAAASPSQMYAAAELRRFIREMTGADLAFRTDDQPLPRKAILLGETAHTARVLGAKPDMMSLGDDGFRLVTAGDRICILGGAARGTLYGVYELLERYWGCRWYASFHSVIPRRKTLFLDPVDDIQKPAFMLREPYWWEMRDGDFAARCRANGHGMGLETRHGGKIRFGRNMFCHTFYDLVPPAEFFESHPEYFSFFDGKRQVGRSQLCLTNSDVLRIVTERTLSAIRSDPTAQLFSVSQNDWAGRCKCERCLEIETREDSPAGPLIHFVNQVAEQVEKESPGVWIETLSYWYTRKPPKTIRPRHNVAVRLSTILCDFSRPLHRSPHPANALFVEELKGWSALTDKLIVWDYTTNFHNYVGPHPNFAAMSENIRLFRDQGAVGVFEQGANEGPHAEFGELRAWLIAKLLWHPDQPVEGLLDDFFAGYYGVASVPIREYFDELQELLSNADTPLLIYDPIRTGWLTMSFVRKAERLWARAEKLARNDPDLLWRVRMGGMPVLWARLKLMGAPSPRFVIRGGRLLHRGADPAYLAAGRELLLRVEEGGVWVREGEAAHRQEILDIARHVQGHKLVEAADAGVRVATAPTRGGSALIWSVMGSWNLLSPDGGGLEIVNRHTDLDRPGADEFEAAETAPGRIVLRSVPPRIAQTSNPPREAVTVERALSVRGDELILDQTFRMERQTEKIAPAVRVGLRLDGAVVVKAGGCSKRLVRRRGTNDSFMELREAMLGNEVIQIGVGGVVFRVDLSKGRKERITVRVDSARRAVVLTALYPEREVGPGRRRRYRVALSSSGIRCSIPRWRANRGSMAVEWCT